MAANINNIVHSLFKVNSLQDVSSKQLEDLCKQYPYFSTSRFLLSKKLCQEKADNFNIETEKTALYFNNPFWLQWLLQNSTDEVIAHKKAAEQPVEINTEERISKIFNREITKSSFSNTNASHSENGDDLLVFEPYHTVDYFASQGIKFVAEENPKDKFGKQLKSFTDWLKIMKKLPQQNKELAVNDVSEQAAIENFAAHSVQQKEILTEAMAEVLAKQGKTQDAVELYKKLSLLNNAKSAYFAAKIEQLNIH